MLLDRRADQRIWRAAAEPGATEPRQAYYCGIDLHARTLYLCILDRESRATGGTEIGSVHLKWAFSEAAVLFLRNNPAGQRHLRRLAGRHGKAKALSTLAARIGRAVYFMLKRERAFEMARFLPHS